MADINVATFEEFDAAILSAQSGDNIIVTDDMALTHPVTIDEDLKIDFGNKNIVIGLDNNILVTGGATVTFTNAKFTNTGVDPIIVSGESTKLILKKVTANVSNTLVVASNGGELQLEGSTITSSDTAAPIRVTGSGSVVTVKSGTITSKNYSAIVAQDGGSIQVNGSTIETQCNETDALTAYPAINISDKNSTLVMNGGTIKSAHTSAVVLSTGSTALITKGKILTNSDSYATIIVQDDATTLRVEGGTITNSGTNCAVTVECSNANQTNHVAISGGDFTTAPGQYVINGTGTGNHVIEISGGTFTGLFTEGYVAAGFRANTNEGVTTIDEVAVETSGVEIEEEKPPVEDDEEEEMVEELVQPEPTIEPIVEEEEDYYPEDEELIQPAPQPKPQPEPQPKPTTKPASTPDPVVTAETETTSIALYEPKRVYANPSFKFCITDIIGSVTIYPQEFVDPVSKLTFRPVRFILPGMGREAFGYMLSTDLA